MTTFLSPEIKKEITSSTIDRLPSAVQKNIREIFGENVTDQILAHETTGDNEDIFEAFSHSLPDELLHRSVANSISERKSLLESLNSVLSLIEQRSDTWGVDGGEPYKEEVLATIKLLSGARFDESLFLGRGNAGHVFSVPDSNDFCIKYLHNPSRQSSNIDEEFTLLGQVNEVARNFEVLKTPQAHALAKNIDGTKNFFTMEKINGLTLAQIVSFPSKRKTEYPDMTTEDIIARLSDPSLREKLHRDLNTLHNSGIIHGDIHERNIMLNSHGEIYLIDFGNAVIPVNVSVHASYENIENVKELDIKAFFNTIDVIVSQLKKQLTE